ncbi:MAG: 50S ribosomal protein L3 [Clostridia bacterium]|nr:50S ribosomal protein L3 [Clostridia bacterium]MBR2327278.1 50S ribosomal protein L3 [Clostridia bacterium]
MVKAIIGRKIGMTQIFTEEGNVVPVTLIEAGPCVVAGKKTAEKDGYDAVVLGYKDISEKKVVKPAKGAFDKMKVAYKKYLKEFKLDNGADMNVGDTVEAGIFAVGDVIDVTGTSKGKGYSGTIKRWGTHRGPSAHGSGYHRGQGSMGANSSPSRVFKGKVMPGQLGNEQVTVKNLVIVKIDTEANIIAVKGAVPGARNGIVSVKKIKA